MTIFSATTSFEVERALISPRRLWHKLLAPRAAAASLSSWSERDVTGLDRGDSGMLGAVAGTAAILLVKVSMVWTALQGIS